MPPTTRTGLLAVGVALAVALIATQQHSADAPPPREFVVAHPLEVFPAESLSDWVSYASHVSVVRVVSEEQLPWHPEVVQNGEGYVERTVHLRLVDDLWTDPDGGSTLEPDINIVTWGWILKDGTLIPIRPDTGPRLEVGRDYVIPMVRTSAGWGTQTSDSVLPIVDGRIAVELGEADSIGRGLNGLAAGDLRPMLAATPRDPVAVSFWHLEPEARADAVIGVKYPD